MQIGKTVAAHHELAYGTARLQHAKSMQEAALVTVDLVGETTLQGLACVIESLLRVAQAVEQLAPQRARATLDLSLEIDYVRDNQFGGGTRSGGAQVGDKIADSEIDFVTDRRDNWHNGVKYRACNDFFIELPQIFDAAANACHNHEIDRRKRLVRHCQLANGNGDFLRCAASLYTHRIDQNLQPWRATTEHVQHIADGCSALRRHNSNSPREFRQRPFPFLRK